MPLPESRERLSWAAVLAVLRSDPTIGAGGTSPVAIYEPADGIDQLRTLTVEGGTSRPHTAYPPPSEMPYLRVSVARMESRRKFENAHETDLTVGLEMFAAGTDTRDALDLYGAVRDALFPKDDPRRAEVRTLLTTAGFVFGNFAGTGPEVVAVGEEAHGQRVLGALVVKLTV